MEYVSGLVVSMVILLMGVELGKSSVEKILRPEEVTFSPVVVGILIASIAVKLYMAAYNRSVSKRSIPPPWPPPPPTASATAWPTSAVLLSTLAGHFFHVSIDGWCGAAVACFILWAGINAARETINPLLGQPPSPEFVREVQSLVLSHPEIIGIHDPDGPRLRPRPGGSCPSTRRCPPAGTSWPSTTWWTPPSGSWPPPWACMATIHMDPVVTDDGLTAETREKVAALAKIIDPGISIHDFRMVTGPTHTNVIFDVVVPFDCRLTDRDVADRIRTAVRTLDGNYYAVVEVEKKLRMTQKTPAFGWSRGQAFCFLAKNQWLWPKIRARPRRRPSMVARPESLCCQRCSDSGSSSPKITYSMAPAAKPRETHSMRGVHGTQGVAQQGPQK